MWSSGPQMAAGKKVFPEHRQKVQELIRWLQRDYPTDPECSAIKHLRDMFRCASRNYAEFRLHQPETLPAAYGWQGWRLWHQNLPKMFPAFWPWWFGLSEDQEHSSIHFEPCLAASVSNKSHP